MLAEAYELGHTRIDASRVRIVVPGERRMPPKTITYRQIDMLLARRVTSSSRSPAAATCAAIGRSGITTEARGRAK